MKIAPPRVSRATLAVLAWVSLWSMVGVAIVHRTRRAIAELREAPSVSFVNFGWFTREATDFQWLLHVPGAERRFVQLVEGGSPAARVFGACGLYLLQSEQLDAARDHLSIDDAEVELGGCLRISRQVREMVSDLPGFCDQTRLSVFHWGWAEFVWLTGR